MRKKEQGYESLKRRGRGRGRGVIQVFSMSGDTKDVVVVVVVEDGGVSK
jgi:hypothetical protein